MIKSLHIENYVLIDTLDLCFNGGLTTITGETGAGKSILLGAMSLMLGARGDASVISTGATNCVIEGVFDIGGYDLKSLFEDNDIDYSDETTIRRVISSSGKGRSYVNDLPVSQSVLKSLGERIVDIHSQHQTLLLGKDDFQMGVLDSVADNASLMSLYSIRYNKIKDLKRDLEQIKEQASSSARDQEYFMFQYEQLSQAMLVSGEMEELEESQKTLTHAAEIKEGFFTAAAIISDDEDSVLSRVKNAHNTLDRLSGFSQSAEVLSSRLNDVIYELKDIYGECSDNIYKIEDSPERLAQVEARLDMIYTLERKHGVSGVDELIRVRDEFSQKLDTISGFSDNIEKIEKEIVLVTVEAEKIARDITQKRSEACAKVEKYVENQLHQLGMENARLKIILSQEEELTRYGFDQVCFMFSANKGRELEPIEKVASGGEMSRLMLSLKSLIATHRRMPAIIFDEIDTGVSGRVADKMGEIMETLSENMQVINITHLPQVAVKGRQHLFVYKDNDSARTVTVIRELSEQERVECIASMLSGSNITDAARIQAKELLSK